MVTLDSGLFGNASLIGPSPILHRPSLSSIRPVAAAWVHDEFSGPCGHMPVVLILLLNGFCDVLIYSILPSPILPIYLFIFFTLGSLGLFPISNINL